MGKGRVRSCSITAVSTCLTNFATFDFFFFTTSVSRLPFAQSPCQLARAWNHRGQIRTSFQMSLVRSMLLHERQGKDFPPLPLVSSVGALCILCYPAECDDVPAVVRSAWLPHQSNRPHQLTVPPTILVAKKVFSIWNRDLKGQMRIFHAHPFCHSTLDYPLSIVEMWVR